MTVDGMSLADWIIDISGSICENVDNCGNCRFYDWEKVNVKGKCVFNEYVERKLKDVEVRAKEE